MPTILKLLGIVLLSSWGALLMSMNWQRKLIYFPSRDSEERLLEKAHGKGMSAWRNADRELIGWKASAPGTDNGSKAIVVFHGNAGYALYRDYFVDGFLALDDKDDWTIYLFEYPGYGARPGSPSEKRLKEAAGEAVASLFSKEYDRLFLVGESIGTGVATAMASRYPEGIDGLLLITPFTRLSEVAGKHYPFLPVRMLLKDRYDNLAALESYGGPVAFLIAGADEIVPPSLGHKLYEAYTGPKKIWVQQGRGHNTLNYDPQAFWWREVIDFLQNPERVR